jgi:hypothetical protein
MRIVVDEHDGHHLAGGARQERLVGPEQVLVQHRGFLDRDAEIARQLDDELARDAGQQAGVDRRRHQAALAHDEQVRLRALRDLAAEVAHDRFERAEAQRVLHGQRVVQQVVRLDERVERRRVVAHDRHERHAHAERVDVTAAAPRAGGR